MVQWVDEVGNDGSLKTVVVDSPSFMKFDEVPSVVVVEDEIVVVEKQSATKTERSKRIRTLQRKSIREMPPSRRSAKITTMNGSPQN